MPTHEIVLLRAGPELCANNDGNWVDVTDSAAEHLNYKVELDGATVRSIFQLVRRNPILQTIYRHELVEGLLKEFEEEVASGECPEDAPVYGVGFSHLLLKRILDENTAERVQESNYVYVTAVTNPLLEDQDDGGFKKGEQVNLSISFRSPLELADLPIRLDPETIVQESDPHSERSFQPIREYKKTTITLNELLHWLFYEIGWNGLKEEREARFSSLEASAEAIKSGEAETTRADNILTDPLFSGKVSRAMTEMLVTPVDLDSLTHLIHRIPDAANAAGVLEEEFPEAWVRNEYRHLNGRDFRKAWSDIAWRNRDDSDEV